MNRVTSRVTLLATIMGFSLGAVIAADNVNAAEKEIIIHEAIHDYADDAGGSFKEGSSRWSRSGYDVKIVLDEAYHDYQRTDVAALETPEGSIEQAEIAAFEEDSFNVPWELGVVD